ncbi:TPA: pyrroline-5-carboxylate reductase [Pseudomonas aeruginosa]|uniref:pyrroline-5-carboxylate reductase n=1 Tax=Pseudomonas aeruginosa TaxID=287 RepID=UPI002076B1A5|nr:pyrroline-5-carboxylate reductase [Pseudomonas aeruginosa]MCM8577369.1 pyrroline-5-carboxylate reductase [Pseudomonas aeruginosa]HCF4324172.1 pyrroline-5-carboxylate reductase [Pseudomonas aeruginosa]HDQ4754604.1 pyrroline-5-carboxylate reductase [Pseudomonas aeruginosa]
MTANHRIGFIGAGSMSQAILAGLVRSGNFSPATIGVVGKTGARAAQLSERFNIEHDASIETLAANSDVLCLCVKPKDLQSVSRKLEGVALQGKLVVSTLAGVSLETLRKHFPRAYLVRSIPNIASAVGEGVTLWSAEELPTELHELVQLIWQSVGASLEVAHEDHIELGSPISGAAPAFLGIFAEALVDAAVYLGLPRDMASQLVLQSLKGSCELIQQENCDAHLVRQRVTSPGGLTAACIATLEAKGFRSALLDAVVAGHVKTTELGQRSSTA